MFNMRAVKVSTCMLMWVFPVILLPAALLTLPTMANAEGGDQNLIKACVNPSGLTRIMLGPYDRCNPSEKPVQWSASTGGNLTVVDSQGKTVGPLIGQTTVVLTVGPDRFFVSVGPNGFNNGVALYYEQANCPGSPLTVPTNGGDFLPTLKPVGTIGYYGGKLPKEHPILSAKSYDTATGALSCSNYASPQKKTLTEANTVNLPVFTPPFSLK